MFAHAAAVILPVIVAALYVYVAGRLRLFSVASEGKYLYTLGGILVLLVALWGALSSSATYGTWFVITAYPWISFFNLFVLVIGLALTALGIERHARLQQVAQEEVEAREGKLSVLENLQHDARGPYQLLELLNLALRETLLQYPETCGAVFLVNRSQRMLVLGAVSGFTKNETVHLEHFPLGNNLVSRAIEIGEPALTSSVDLTDADGKRMDSRFQSGIVLPLCSGMEKIGAILLAAERPKSFTPVDVKYLAPIAEWLAEKIRTARLTRELAVVRSEVEDQAARSNALLSRLFSLASAVSSDNPIPGFCHALAGLLGSSSAQVLGLQNGAIVFYGGTEPIGAMNESLRTALADALERRKPVVINHESGDASGRTIISRSSLVFPIPQRKGIDALMLVRESGPIAVSDGDLKLLQSCAALAALALDFQDAHRRDLTRRIGIDKVLQLLSAKPLPAGESRTTAFVRHLSDILPNSAIAISFDSNESGVLSPVEGLNADRDILSNLHITAGEGIVGDATAAGETRFVFGKRELFASLERFDSETRQVLQRLFGERRLPNFMAALPVRVSEQISGVVLLFLFDLPESERLEWERLLQLAAGLFSVRLSLEQSHARSDRVLASGIEPPDAYTINELNNHLSAVIGNAELISQRADLPGELRAQLKGIIAEAERAAGLVHANLTPTAAGNVAAGPSVVPATTLDAVVEQVLSQSRISGNLYMAGGRPREIRLTLKGNAEISLTTDTQRQFFETALARFASTAADDDMFTISSYRRDDYLYLDVSRHHKNFPPVEAVAGFGDYQFAELAFDGRPSDVYLQPLAGSSSAYAVDRQAVPPAYLSFRFPLKGTPQPKPGPTSIRILAIDDQPVILDLISAMCQSLEYSVATASTAEAGIRLAQAQKFDIVLTDLAMPDMSGLEVARQIRRVHPDIPIVLVTGWEAGIDPNQMKSAGITEVLYKPFRIEQLTDIVRSAAPSRR